MRTVADQVGLTDRSVEAVRKHAAKQHQGRRQDVIHPSEMASHDWCPRQTFYRIRNVRAGVPYEREKFSVGTLAIFDEGHTIHAKWQKRLEELSLLHGRWKCLTCRWVTPTLDTNPEVCENCGAAVMEYAEVPMNAEEQYMIVGHADGYVPDYDCLIEIKSIGLGTLRMDVPDLLRKHTVTTDDGRKIHDLNGIWNDLDAPLEPHVKQANVYLAIAGMQGLNADRMVFLYEFKANQQVKEFMIYADGDVINPLLKSASEIRDAILHDAPPPAQAHQQDSATCKKCPYLTECWTPDANARQAPEPDRPAIEAGRSGPDLEGSPATPRRRRVVTTRPPGRRDAAAPGRRDRTVRRGPDEPLRTDGGLEQVRRRQVRSRRSGGEGN